MFVYASRGEMCSRQVPQQGNSAARVGGRPQTAEVPYLLADDHWIIIADTIFGNKTAERTRMALSIEL